MLAINFADFQRYFAEELIEMHRAHLAMLAERQILPPDQARMLLAALSSLNLEELRAARFDGSCEDFFFYVEEKIAACCDPDVAGRLHTARSRNDIAITLYRMAARRQILRVASAALELRRVLFGLACAHRNTLMPAFTHTQPAQPTVLAHYLLAMVELLERDTRRLEAAYQTVNRCPMGACAITTTAFPIDRERTAHLLGFDGLLLNSYGAIAAVDYLLESAGAVATGMVNLGRFTQDVLLWGMREFQFLRLPEGFVQSSSIMPQKRNPVAVEHTRILASRAFSEAQAIMTSLHNTPFGDIVDSEDDLQPLVFMMFEDARRALQLLAASLEKAQFDTARMRAEAGRHFLTATELADTLVREGNLSFREAHQLVSQAVKSNPETDTPARIVDELLRLAPGVVGRDALLAAVDPQKFVERRAIAGGPAAPALGPQLERAQQTQADLAEWVAGREAHLRDAHAELHRWSI